MERLPDGLYSPEFRAEVLKLVEQTGMSESSSILVDS